MMYECVAKELFFIKQVQNDRISYAFVDTTTNIVYELSIACTSIETCAYDIIDEIDLDKLDTKFISKVIQEIESMLKSELSL